MKKIYLLSLIIINVFSNLNSQNKVFGPLPDLVVSSATNFKLAYANTQVSYDFQIDNLQNTPCYKNVSLQGYWSKTNTISNLKLPPSGGIFINSKIIKGTPQKGNFTMNVPNPIYYPAFKGWTLSKMLKEYPYLILVIDEEKGQPETNEKNNYLIVKHGLH